MKYKNSSQSGFSLVETLVAITILLIVIVGPLTIGTSTARSTSFSSEQTVAFFLAQEGAEIVQKGRDDLLLQDFGNPQNGWDDFSDTGSSSYYEDCFLSTSNTGCGLELDDNDWGTVINKGACSGTTCDLYFDSAGDRMGYTHEPSGNEKTLYKREIYFIKYGVDSVQVRSRVTWRTGSLRDIQEVVVDTYLYNVYGN